MACALTQGLVIDCRDSMGGVSHIFVIESANIETITSASGVVTAIEKVATKRFWKYNLPKNTGVAGSTYAGNDENGTGVWSQEISIAANKMTASVRNEIVLLSQNSVKIVVVDKNGKGWLYGGENSLTMNAGSTSTGTNAPDRNGYTMVFSGQERIPEYEVDTATLSTLETPGS